MSLKCLFGHKWDGCKCEICGKIRNTQHNWKKTEILCVAKCTICGKENKPEHQFVNDVCKVCGYSKTLLGYYLVGEVGDKESDALQNIMTPLQPLDMGKQIAKNNWKQKPWSGSAGDCSKEYYILFRAIGQLLQTNPKFKEKLEPLGKIFAGSGNYNGQSIAVDNLNADFDTKLQTYLQDKKVDGDIFYLHGNEQFIQLGGGFNEYISKWKLALFFYSKMQAGESIREQGTHQIATSILEKYRSGLLYLNECGAFDKAKFHEFNRIIGNRFSDADIETQLNNAELMLKGMEDLKQSLRSTMAESVHTFEELAKNGIDLSKYDV